MVDFELIGIIELRHVPFTDRKIQEPNKIVKFGIALFQNREIVDVSFESEPYDDIKRNSCRDNHHKHQ